jgi:hypothetical protein
MIIRDPAHHNFLWCRAKNMNNKSCWTTLFNSFFQ